LVEVKEVVWSATFEQDVKKTKDGSIKERIMKQIVRIVENPDIGKPLRFDLKGERTVYLKPFRIVYKIDNGVLTLLRFEHRKGVYG
jgi:mRNA-degrading endonuclease RelE of RelBE toxin-antitoxin system